MNIKHVDAGRFRAGFPLTRITSAVENPLSELSASGALPLSTHTYHQGFHSFGTVITLIYSLWGPQPHL